MSTLRVSNIEAKADVSSPSVNEKVKVTNSNGELLVHIDGATLGITTVGINTSGESVRFDSNQNVTFFGDITGTGLDINGNADISGNLNVGGVLTYEDVTNIDSVGIITARSGIKVTSGDILVTGGDGRKISFASDGSAHYIKMDNTFNGPVINGYGGIKFETNGTNERLRITSTGSAQFTGQVTSTNTSYGFTSNATSFPFTAESSLGNGGKAFYAKHTSSGSSSRYLFYGENNAGEVFSVDTSGSADFAGSVDAADGHVELLLDSGNGRIKLNSSGDATNIDLFGSNGSATFAGGALAIASSGNLSINRTSGTNDILNGKLNGSVTSTLNANGLIELGSASNSTNNNGLYLGGHNGSFNLYTTRYNSDCFQILNTSGSGTNVALRTYGNGDVEIAGIIQTNIKSAGNIQLDSTGAFTSPKITLFANSGTGIFGSFNDGSSTGYGVKINLAANAGDVRAQCQQTASQYTRLFDGLFGTNTVFSVVANGNLTVAGQVTAAGGFSDIRFKENITDANPQLADVVDLGSQLKNWDWKDNAPLNEELRAKRFLGLVAQEAEKVCPGLTYTVSRTKQGAEITPETTDAEGNVTPATYEDLDDSCKAINHDILVMKLLGAVAEQNTQIETLKTQNASLEARLTALEGS